MTPLEYWRVLAIKVAAAGPYQVVDRCHFCGAVEALASFQPSAFAARVACCRRCREARTGVPDERGLIRATASVSRPLEELTPVKIRGLIPATCGETRPVDPLKEPVDYVGKFDFDYVFAPLTPAERLEQFGEGPEAEILALSDLDQQLDAMIADLDRRAAGMVVGDTVGILSSSTDPAATSSETKALTLDAMADLTARYGRKYFRIIAGCPAFPPDSAFEWPRRAVLFVGSEVLEALGREAERLDFFSQAIGRPLEPTERKMFGVEVEPWGSKDDHPTLAVELARELDPS
jgi:hypothetical protein